MQDESGPVSFGGTVTFTVLRTSLMDAVSLIRNHQRVVFTFQSGAMLKFFLFTVTSVKHRPINVSQYLQFL